MNKILDEIQAKRKEYITDYYAMSVGEIMNMYRDNELIINPDFQRFFRWSENQKSNLMESFFLGIPIPSIFVYQRADGIWELVDGLQRVGTVLEFFGVFKDPQGKVLPELVLTETDIIKDLDGLTKSTLPSSVILDLKRSKFKVEIIQKESDTDAKYEVFMRLNTGGSFLSSQELRNAWLVMFNKEFYEWLVELSKNKNFTETVGLSDKLKWERYDLELILTFLVYPDDFKEFIKFDKNGVLTKGLKKLAKRAMEGDLDLAKLQNKFENTFYYLNKTLGEDCFKKYYKDGGRFKGGLLESMYECIAIGLSQNIDSYCESDIDLIEEKIKGVWDEPTFTDNMGSGTNTKRRVPVMIPFGQRYFAK